MLNADWHLTKSHWKIGVGGLIQISIISVPILVLVWDRYWWDGIDTIQFQVHIIVLWFPTSPKHDMSVQTPLLSHYTLLLHSTAPLSCCHMTQQGRERHVLQRTGAIAAHVREKVEWSLELFHSSEQKIFALSPMKVHKLLLEVKCIGISTSIGKSISATSPAITSNLRFPDINTKPITGEQDRPWIE